MCRRHIKSDFAPDVFVFPGGKADPKDALHAHLLDCSTPPPTYTGEEPAIGWPAIYIAAIRELFEETGALLARHREKQTSFPTLSTEVIDRLPAYREGIRSGSVTMADLAREEELLYMSSMLRLFSNWITPPVLKRRFDTFFFAVPLPEGQLPRHADLHELTDSAWITPSKALDDYRKGHFPLVFATERNLERLSRFDCVAAVRAGCERDEIQPVNPRWTMRGEERVFLIPEDPGYEDAARA